MCNLINTHTHTYTNTHPRAVMCNLINTHTRAHTHKTIHTHTDTHTTLTHIHTHTHTHTHTHVHTYHAEIHFTSAARIAKSTPKLHLKSLQKYYLQIIYSRSAGAPVPLVSHHALTYFPCPANHKWNRSTSTTQQVSRVGNRYAECDKQQQQSVTDTLPLAVLAQQH